MPTTPRGFPYPSYSDAPDIPGDIQALAEALDASVSIPAGLISAFGGNGSIPSGWLLCNGSSFSATAYPSLYATLGTTLLPNLTDKFIMGAASSGSTGGSKKITTANLPAHTHGWAGTNAAGVGFGGGHTHNLVGVQTRNIYGSGGSNWANYYDGAASSLTTTSSGSHTHSVYLETVGEGTDYLPPYYKLRYLIKAH